MTAAYPVMVFLPPLTASGFASSGGDESSSEAERGIHRTGERSLLSQTKKTAHVIRPNPNEN